MAEVRLPSCQGGHLKTENFFNTILNLLMKKAEDGEISLLFLDTSHFVMRCDFLGHIYGRVCRYVRTFFECKCYNVLGVLDYVSKKMLVVANDSYITISEICDMLQKVKTEYDRKKVHIVLDNARYQKCHIVQELVRQLDIQLEYIPSCSPNLNLIERVWKYIKGEISSIAIQENINNINKRRPTKIMSIKNIKFCFAYYQFIGLL